MQASWPQSHAISILLPASWQYVLQYLLPSSAGQLQAGWAHLFLSFWGWGFSETDSAFISHSDILGLPVSVMLRRFWKMERAEIFRPALQKGLARVGVLRTRVPFEEGASCWGEVHDVAAVRCVEGDEAAVVRVFPHWEFGTGRTPGIHGFFVGSVALRQPLQEIEDEVFGGGIAHFCVRSVQLYIW